MTIDISNLGNDLFGERLGQSSMEEKTNLNKELNSAMTMCHVLEALNLTLNKQTSWRDEDIQKALLNQVRDSNHDF